MALPTYQLFARLEEPRLLVINAVRSKGTCGKFWPDELDAGASGVCAQAIQPAGELDQDFLLTARPNALHVLNTPSAAATASLAIAAEIAGMVESK